MDRDDFVTYNELAGELKALRAERAALLIDAREESRRDVARELRGFKAEMRLLVFAAVAANQIFVALSPNIGAAIASIAALMAAAQFIAAFFRRA